MGLRGEVFSWRTSSENDRRTYFFNLKETRTGDLFLTIVESKKLGEEEFERRQIQVFQEDFDRFRVGIDKVFDHIRDNKPAPRKEPERPVRRFKKREKSGDE